MCVDALLDVQRTGEGVFRRSFERAEMNLALMKEGASSQYARNIWNTYPASCLELVSEPELLRFTWSFHGGSSQENRSFWVPSVHLWSIFTLGAWPKPSKPNLPTSEPRLPGARNAFLFLRGAATGPGLLGHCHRDSLSGHWA